MNPVVHLELHTHDRQAASRFYAALLAWQPERIRAGCGSYLALDLGGAVGGGIVECGTRQAGWMPYVKVPELAAATDRAVELGASVLLGPREGPAGWRSVVRSPVAGELALWQLREGR